MESRAAVPPSAHDPTDADGHRLPSISVVSPMYNEASNIADFIADLAAQDSRARRDHRRRRRVDRRHGGDVAGRGAGQAARRSCRRQSATLGLARAQRLHRRGRGRPHRSPRLPRTISARLPQTLALAAEETGAWNVGGRLVPQGRTATERAVACAMDLPFGGIGWTRAASANTRVEVDTVTFGAFRADVFERSEASTSHWFATRTMSSTCAFASPEGARSSTL